jgi:hypothetical protein
VNFNACPRGVKGRAKHLPLAAVEAIACKHLLRSPRGHLRRPVAHREVVHRAPAPAASIIANCCPVHPAALAVAAAVFAPLAFITGLVALYAWLEPTYGVFLPLSIVGGDLAVIALDLLSDAMMLSQVAKKVPQRRRPSKFHLVPSRCR